MRTIVFFDLPTETAEDRRNYRRFRKTLISNGFCMMQESVYIRLLINATAQKQVVNNISKNKPPKGIVQILTVTEKQFEKMDFLVGEYHSDLIDTDERLIII